MSLKSIIAQELKEMRGGISGGSGSSSSSRQQLPRGGRKRRTVVVGSPRVKDEDVDGDGGGGGEVEMDGHRTPWENLPPELLLEVIRRLEASEPSWPGRKQVVVCASVCRPWREITKYVTRTLEESSRITFPASLKQPGPRNSPIQCYIRRERATSTFFLYLGLSPALHGNYGKLLFAARKVKRATSTDFIISLMPEDYSRASNMYVGKLKSNFLGTKFTVYDSQIPYESTIRSNSRLRRRVHSKQVVPRVSAGSYNVTTITYELNVLRTRGPRRMQCTMHSIPASVILDCGMAPNSTSFCHVEEQFSLLSIPRPKNPITDLGSTSRLEPSVSIQTMGEPLVLRNKAPRWHDQLQCWCLNFRGRVTVASVKNFQLVAAVEPCHQISPVEQEKVILQFGKIGKDIFTMDYQYPISAFQAFAICLSSFDTKPACE